MFLLIHVLVSLFVFCLFFALSVLSLCYLFGFSLSTLPLASRVFLFRFSAYLSMLIDLGSLICTDVSMFVFVCALGLFICVLQNLVCLRCPFPAYISYLSFQCMELLFIVVDLCCCCCCCCWFLSRAGRPCRWPWRKGVQFSSVQGAWRQTAHWHVCIIHALVEEGSNMNILCLSWGICIYWRRKGVICTSYASFSPSLSLSIYIYIFVLMQQALGEGVIGV